MVSANTKLTITWDIKSYKGDFFEDVLKVNSQKWETRMKVKDGLSRRFKSSTNKENGLKFYENLKSKFSIQ